MADSTPEREYLALTNRHIAEEEARVADQKLLVARASAVGQDTSLAVRMLQTLEESLMQARGHRDAILRVIEDLTPAKPRLS